MARSRTMSRVFVGESLPTIRDQDSPRQQQPCELQEVIQSFDKYGLDHIEVEFLIIVHGDVPEAHHPPEAFGK